MNIQVVFKHMEHSDSLETYAKEKSEKLSKYLDGKMTLTWNFVKEHGEFVSHCHALGNHMDLFGEARADDAYATVDMAIAKLEKQIKKHKEIVTEH